MVAVGAVELVMARTMDVTTQYRRRLPPRHDSSTIRFRRAGGGVEPLGHFSGTLFQQLGDFVHLRRSDGVLSKLEVGAPAGGFESLAGGVAVG